MRGGGYGVVRKPITIGGEVGPEFLALIAVSLGDSKGRYLSTTFNPTGSVSLTRLSPGELIPIGTLAKAGEAEINEEISLSLRSVDIPIQVGPGSLVSIYQLHDAKNGEVTSDPFQILQRAQVISLDRKGSNFGGEVALTISASPRDVYRLLAASTSGRLVAVRSHE